MSDFELVSNDGSPVIIDTVIPEQFAHLRMSGCEGFLATTNIGDLIFHHYPGDGFDIWKSNYHIHKDGKLTGRSHKSLIEFTVMYENSFSIDWKGVVKAPLPFRSMELYFSPAVENTGSFKGGQRFTTVDFHYHAGLLDLYAPRFPLLSRFMDNVYAERATTLFNGNMVTNEAIDKLIAGLISYSFREDLASDYYDSFANILLIHLLEKISGFHPDNRKFSLSDKEKAHEARRLLTMEVGRAYRIKELCTILQTNPYNLKTTFKHLFSKSIGEYKRETQIEYAKVLLETTDLTMDEVASLSGYATQQRFTSSFKAAVKETPLAYRNKRR